jgi:hypothetical protein
MPRRRQDYTTEFGQYYSQLGEGGGADLARACNTRQSYLHALATGSRTCGMDMASRLCAVDENITLGMLRPDLFSD